VCGLKRGFLIFLFFVFVFQSLVKKHYNTKFVRINVDAAPFFVSKLKVQVLPCIVSFIDGNVVDRQDKKSHALSQSFFTS